MQSAVEDRAQEPVEELQRLKSQFLASLNHEIRTPLSGILGMIDLLLETNLDDLQREYLATTRVCAEDLLELLNSALEFSALSAGGLPLEESEFNLLEVLRGVVDQNRVKAQAKGLRLIADFNGNLPAAVIGDALRLRQILCQLLGNAIKFTTAGEVELKASAKWLPDSRCMLMISVRDTGIGISPEQFKFLFQSFRQLESGLGRRFPGLGLGLALAQQLVRLMHGEITAESEPGKGSVFSFAIPLRVSRELAAAPTRDFGAAEQTVAEKRILLVEDDIVARRIVAHMLARGRYGVDSVGSGDAAIAAAAGRRYDLILMDLQMPGMDGVETAAAIRALPDYSGVPIIALTAHTTEEYRAYCRERGLQGFLTKPVRSEELLAALAQHLN